MFLNRYITRVLFGVFCLTLLSLLVRQTNITLFSSLLIVLLSGLLRLSKRLLNKSSTKTITEVSTSYRSFIIIIYVSQLLFGIICRFRQLSSF